MSMLTAQATPPAPRYAVVFKSLDALCVVYDDGLDSKLKAFTGLWAVFENESPMAYCPTKPFALAIAAALNWRQEWLAWSYRIGSFLTSHISNC